MNPRGLAHGQQVDQPVCLEGNMLLANVAHLDGSSAQVAVSSWSTQE